MLETFAENRDSRITLSQKKKEESERPRLIVGMTARWFPSLFPNAKLSCKCSETLKK